MTLRPPTHSLPKVTIAEPGPNQVFSTRMLELVPLSGSWSAQGPLPPLMAMRSSLFWKLQPVMWKLLQASMSTPSEDGAGTGFFGA